MFSVTILTIDKKVYEGEASALIVPGALGYFEVLVNHAAIMTSLQPGKLTVALPQGQKNIYAISGGLMEMYQNRAVVLGDTIESSGEIDYARAKAAHQRAYKRLELPDEDIDQHRATQALLRAKNRMEVSARKEP